MSKQARRQHRAGSVNGDKRVDLIEGRLNALEDLLREALAANKQLTPEEKIAATAAEPVVPPRLTTIPPKEPKTVASPKNKITVGGKGAYPGIVYFVDDPKSSHTLNGRKGMIVYSEGMAEYYKRSFYPVVEVPALLDSCGMFIRPLVPNELPALQQKQLKEN